MQDKLIKKIILMVGIIAVLGVASSPIVLSSPASAQKGPEFIPGRYIVVLQDGVSPQDVIKANGAVPDFVYRHAINGFAGPISPIILENLKQDSRVKFIEQDQRVYAFAQTTPTGIDRIDAEDQPSAATADVVVAVLDTGIDDTHPDLNVIKKVNCAGGSPFGGDCIEDDGNDGHGHGTHVSGTIGAIDNVVKGVAPGVKLVAVKVLDDNGRGWTSWIIGGIDYVTSTRNNEDPNDDIDVVNMSLGGGNSESEKLAIQNSIAVGVVYVVAAGNGSTDAANTSPANTPGAITVSAIADSDGQCGGIGLPTNYGDDDTFASFSNYGSFVDIAGPGVNILSTLPGEDYGTASGTSMASPHVAGAAALYIIDNGKPVNAAQVEALRDGLVSAGVNQIEGCVSETGYGGFLGDTDGIPEPLVYVGPSNIPPVLAAIGNQIVVEETPLTFTASATDADVPPDTLTFSLANGLAGLVPAGASIDGSSGVFTWTPTEAQGPDTFTFDVVVSDGTDTDSETIDVVVISSADIPVMPTFDLFGSGGKNSDKHMNVYVTITGDGIPLSGVTINITLFKDNIIFDSTSATTNDAGTARLSVKNAPGGCYFAELDTTTSLPSGFVWDPFSVYTSNSEDKTGNPC